jgi:hypothetical protein
LLATASAPEEPVRVSRSEPTGVDGEIVMDVPVFSVETGEFEGVERRVIYTPPPKNTLVYTETTSCLDVLPVPTPESFTSADKVLLWSLRDVQQQREAWKNPVAVGAENASARVAEEAYGLFTDGRDGWNHLPEDLDPEDWVPATTACCGLIKKRQAPEIYRLPRWRRQNLGWIRIIDHALAARHQRVLEAMSPEERKLRPPRREIRDVSDVVFHMMERTCIIPQLGVELAFIPGQLTLGAQKLRESWVAQLNVDSGPTDEAAWRQFYLLLEQEYLETRGNSVAGELNGRLMLEKFNASRGFFSCFGFPTATPKILKLQKIAGNSVLRSMYAVGRMHLAQYNGKEVRAYLERTLVPIFRPFVSNDVEHWVSSVVDFLLEVNGVPQYF